MIGTSLKSTSQGLWSYLGYLYSLLHSKLWKTLYKMTVSDGCGHSSSSKLVPIESP